MSKTRKRVLSALAILFAAALVFTACLALTGCGDSEEDWSEDWTEYKFEFEANGANTSMTSEDDVFYLYVYSDGTFWAGPESWIGTATAQAGTNGWWGYLDGSLTFVRSSGGTSYSICEMSTSGNSVTISFSSTMLGSVVVTIDDIGCLAGNTGYDLTTIEIS